MRRQTLSKVSAVSGSKVEEQAVQRMSGGVKKGGRLFQTVLIKTNNNSNLIWVVTRRVLLLSCGCYFTCLCLGSSFCVCALLIHSGSLHYLDQIDQVKHCTTPHALHRTDTESLFPPGLNMIQSQVDNSKCAPPRRLGDAFRSEHIQRWSGPHVTTFFQQYVRKCVLGHIKGPPTQMTSSAKQEDATTGKMDSRTHGTCRLIFIWFTVILIMRLGFLTCQGKQQMFVNTLFQMIPH